MSKTAAQLFQVPASTTYRHRQKLPLNNRVDRPNYFNFEEETYVASILQLLPDYGYNITPDVALQLAAEYLESLKLSRRPG